MTMRLCAASVLVLSLIPVAVRAQTPVSSVTLVDPNPPAWDASGHVSWLTVNKGDIASEWDRWYDVATVGGSVGRFVGRHLKLEFDAATSASAEVYVERRVTVPAQNYVTYIAQPQRFRTTTVSGSASYQLFDNRWLHPFVGAGLESTRETRTISDISYPTAPGISGFDPPGTTSTWRQRPFGNAGLKWFVSERSFIRSDVRTTFDRGGLVQVSWRTGFGVEF